MRTDAGGRIRGCFYIRAGRPSESCTCFSQFLQISGGFLNQTRVKRVRPLEKTIRQRFCYTNNFRKLCGMRHVTQTTSVDCVECGMSHKQLQKTVWQATCHTGNFRRLCGRQHFTQSVSEYCVAGNILHRQFQKTVWQATFHTGNFSRLCGRRHSTQAISGDCAAEARLHRQFQKTVYFSDKFREISLATRHTICNFGPSTGNISRQQ